MKRNGQYFIALLFTVVSLTLSGQTDVDPPVSPVFTFVTLDPVTGRSDMNWTLSPSSDVAGYVIYLFRDGEGYAIDTLFDPGATGYSVLRPGTTRYSESYVIAAIDGAGNISPLSNELNTIYTELLPDTCNNSIIISWNKYLPVPVKVTGYDILVSVNGGAYYLAGHVSEDLSRFTFENTESGSEYCFRINALLENGRASGSNRPCAVVKSQIPPLWINADYATVTEEGAISLYFTIDPATDINLFTLERKTGFTGSYQPTAQIRSDIKSITYTDTNADLNSVNFYRLSAVNNCNLLVTTSNVASNIVLDAQNTGIEIIMQWTNYREWLGSVSSYRIYTDTGHGFTETAVTAIEDTTYTISIPSIMYTLDQGKICFYITASESGNPYGIAGETRSNTICIEIEEVVTVPNIFSPDGDGMNDLFRPVITFAPESYQLVITDRLRKTVFETNDYYEYWDGSSHGDHVPQGVYLWFLKITTPSGKNITRTGTLTVIKGR
jgi:gliding motility-associated-like protein